MMMVHPNTVVEFPEFKKVWYAKSVWWWIILITWLVAITFSIALLYLFGRMALILLRYVTGGY